ncbi:MAG TPA: ribonucleoside-diphosphate reductase subunit alpha [Pirellulaceae bacterium]|jgi:ribonucleoside-diphosphate reductase alpha chain|nr:ribonucleoside-diphosphate reductase subunit alpha [Pirellulaceae bacterium]
MSLVQTTQEWLVRKRDGRVVPFNVERIETALRKAFRADQGLSADAILDEGVEKEIADLSRIVLEQVSNAAGSDQGVDVEKIQDFVEMQLMRRGHYAVARRYIVYRAEHAKLRALRDPAPSELAERPRLFVTQPDGTKRPLDPKRIERLIAEACQGLEDVCSVEEIRDEVLKTLFDGITMDEIQRAMVLAARTRIERDPAYDVVTSRLMLMIVYREALGSVPSMFSLDAIYRDRFANYLDAGITAGRLSPDLKVYNLSKIAAALQPQRDGLFQYLGLQAIYDRYLIHVGPKRIETPQYFWMRVAMGLAMNEADREARAIEYYDLLSTHRFISATPTLFNSGTLRPQLSSCYLSTVSDDLEHIFKVVSDNAKLSKWAGGLGNDWTNIRATNAHIQGTNGQSQGVIPFLKVVNDTAVAVNQGGKRKGAVCSYLESWHLDVEEFLDLRKNTGDDRRRTHDMHTANWIPDLFMKRVRENREWTLFNPSDVRDLHDLVGKKFEARYEEYERLADEGKLKLFRRLPAVDLWRKMLTRVFETGHPWITWKDPSNVRSPQDHVGVVHSSNLCTEILLNTSQDEVAVCNLGSINLKLHVEEGKLNLPMLEKTVRTAVRMLDNVIDINYYPIEEAKNSNLRHRPIGLGLMGFQDALVAIGIGYASDAAVKFADESMEAISYFAILASADLARERGPYQTYAGSKWDRGLLPIDTIDLLEQERGVKIDLDRSSTMDWSVAREAVAKHGMRNSNVMAIAPTATISTIIGVSQSIEPHYKNLYVKSNLSGEFTQINRDLVLDLKSRGEWNQEMIDALKYYDGSVSEIPSLPDDLKAKYLTAFEIDPKWLIECAARRQKWIDMGMSLNLYMMHPSGKKLHDMYMLAWEKGLKTTYYLRTLAATQVEKSTIDVNRFGIQPRWMKSQSASSDIQIVRNQAALPSSSSGSASSPLDQGELPPTEVKQCLLDDPGCEACQ